MKRVVVFGIFDGVHEGHRSLFGQAREYGEELIAIVGRDEVVEKLKGKRPIYSVEKRIAMLKKEPLVDDAVLGDKELSSYTVLDELSPDAVCLGYDQGELEEDLRKWLSRKGKAMQVRRAKPYQDGTLHNSAIL